MSPVESQVSSGLPWGQGLWLQQTWETQHVSPTIEPMSRQPKNWRKLYQRTSHAVVKLLGPTTDFPTWGFSKGTENPQGISLWRPVWFDYRTSQDSGNRLLEGTNNTLCIPRPRRKEQWPHKILSQTCLWVFRSFQWRHGSTVTWHEVRGTEYNSPGISPFEGGHHYCQYPYCSLTSCQNTGREHSPTHQQKIELKIYWAWPRPLEQEPDCLTASPSHQEASIRLLALFIRGQTEWKPQSQKTNQTNHLDHSLV